MKNPSIPVFAICIAAALPAAAADEHPEHGGEHAAPQHGAPSGQHASPPHGAPAGRPMTQHAAPNHQHATDQGGPGGMSSAPHSRADSHAANRGARSHVDVSSYHRNVSAQHHYHFGNYNAPQGYAYHRYSYGDRLPQGYFDRDYWIVNDLNFGLMAPPDGYVWVRYGPDAVLVDKDTGEIVQIVYDQFY